MNANQTEAKRLMSVLRKAWEDATLTEAAMVGFIKKYGDMTHRIILRDLEEQFSRPTSRYADDPEFNRDIYLERLRNLCVRAIEVAYNQR